jgi:hypothetical protein
VTVALALCPPRPAFDAFDPPGDTGADLTGDEVVAVRSSDPAARLIRGETATPAMTPPVVIPDSIRDLVQPRISFRGQREQV